MNEPDARVLFAILAIALTTPVLVALLTALIARRGARWVWLAWGFGFLIFVAIAWPLAAGISVNAADRAMFTGLIVGTGLATAASAWVVNRTVRADPESSLWRLAGYSVLTSIGIMLLVLRASC